MKKKIERTNISEINNDNSLIEEICDGIIEDENQIPFDIHEYQNFHKFICKNNNSEIFNSLNLEEINKFQINDLNISSQHMLNKNQKKLEEKVEVLKSDLRNISSSQKNQNNQKCLHNKVFSMDFENLTSNKNTEKTKAYYLSNLKEGKNSHFKKLNLIKTPIQLNEESEISEKTEQIQLKTFDCHLNMNFCSNNKIKRKDLIIENLNREKERLKRNIKLNNMTNKNIEMRIQRNFSDYSYFSQRKMEKNMANDKSYNSMKAIFARLSKKEKLGKSNFEFTIKEEKFKKSEEIIQFLYLNFIKSLEKINYAKGKLNFNQFSEILFDLKFTHSKSEQFLKEAWKYIERDPFHGISITSLYAFLVSLINAENSINLSIQIENLFKRMNSKNQNLENSNKNPLNLIDFNLTQESFNTITQSNDLSKNNYKYSINLNTARSINNKFKKFSSNFNFWANLWVIKNDQIKKNFQAKNTMEEIQEVIHDTSNCLINRTNIKNINTQKKLPLYKIKQIDYSHITEKKHDKKDNLVTKNQFMANANQLFQDYKKQHIILHKKTKSSDINSFWADSHINKSINVKNIDQKKPDFNYNINQKKFNNNKLLELDTSSKFCSLSKLIPSTKCRNVYSKKELRYLKNEENTKDGLTLKDSSDNSFKLEYPINKYQKQIKVEISPKTINNNLRYSGNHEDNALELKDLSIKNPSLLANPPNKALPMLCLDTEIRPGHHINLKIYEGDTADIISEKLMKEHGKLIKVCLVLKLIIYVIY